MVITIIAILASIAIMALYSYVTKAYDVTVHHDIETFIKAEEGYFADTGRYLGATGDFIEGGGASSGLNSASLGFMPSKGVRIEIIAGDGGNPSGPPTFKASSNHARASVSYEYDFSTNVITREEK
jgi:type II secretory pathway pseudopilin PulG